MENRGSADNVTKESSGAGGIQEHDFAEEFSSDLPSTAMPSSAPSGSSSPYASLSSPSAAKVDDHVRDTKKLEHALPIDPRMQLPAAGFGMVDSMGRPPVVYASNSDVGPGAFPVRSARNTATGRTVRSPIGSYDSPREFTNEESKQEDGVSNSAAAGIGVYAVEAQRVPDGNEDGTVLVAEAQHLTPLKWYQRRSIVVGSILLACGFAAAVVVMVVLLLRQPSAATSSSSLTSPPTVPITGAPSTPELTAAPSTPVPSEDAPSTPEPTTAPPTTAPITTAPATPAPVANGGFQPVFNPAAIATPTPAPVVNGGFQPVFNPAAIATPTTPPVHVFESLGPTTGKSCLARVGPVCTFTNPECCTAAQSNPSLFFIPGLATQVPCYGAKLRYNSTLSAAFTNAQCNATRNLILYYAGSLCECQAAPTPAPMLLGACAKRANASAFTPCDFLPADKTPAECCPMKQDEGILNLDRSIIDEDYVPCGFANQTLYSDRSSAWPDDWCVQTKQAIEAEAYVVDGCVCPGSDKLNTSAPSRAPAVPSAPPTPRPP